MDEDMETDDISYNYFNNLVTYNISEFLFFGMHSIVMPYIPSLKSSPGCL